jgi:hypothetical protein
MVFLRLLWFIIRLPWWLARLPRRIARLVRRLLGQRWFRRLLSWLLVRQVRRSGARGTARLLLRAARVLLSASWRTTLGLLRLSRQVIRLIGWLDAHRPAALGRSSRRSLPARIIRALPSSRPAAAAEHPSRRRPTLSRRVAQRRDVIRRSLLAAVGADPNWRPARRSTTQSRRGALPGGPTRGGH